MPCREKRHVLRPPVIAWHSQREEVYCPYGVAATLGVSGLQESRNTELEEGADGGALFSSYRRQFTVVRKGGSLTPEPSSQAMQTT